MQRADTWKDGQIYTRELIFTLRNKFAQLSKSSEFLFTRLLPFSRHLLVFSLLSHLFISSPFCFNLPFCTAPFPYHFPFHHLVSFVRRPLFLVLETFITPEHHIPVYVMKNIARACTVPRNAFPRGRNNHHNLISVRSWRWNHIMRKCWPYKGGSLRELAVKFEDPIYTRGLGVGWGVRRREDSDAAQCSWCKLGSYRTIALEAIFTLPLHYSHLFLIYI
jgi:hypothetical protein